MTPVLLARDLGLWVVDKPAGWVTHPVAEPNIPDIVRHAQAEWGAGPGLAPLHRLDRETSGVLLLSEIPEVRRKVGQWLAAGQLEKEYIALVHGRCRPRGVVRVPLSDSRRGRPLEATTRYRLIEALGAFSLLAAHPEQGRKHQIRRHLHAIGHAIVGDTRYRAQRFIVVPGFPDRLWLHAAQLKLPDGRVFQAPLPAELVAHLELLRRG